MSLYTNILLKLDTQIQISFYRQLDRMLVAFHLELPTPHHQLGTDDENNSSALAMIASCQHLLSWQSVRQFFLRDDHCTFRLSPRRLNAYGRSLIGFGGSTTYITIQCRLSTLDYTSYTP